MGHPPRGCLIESPSDLNGQRVQEINNVDSLSTFVQSPLFSRLSVVLGGLIVVGLFWWRAGSIHTVLDRLWRLVAGKADVHDPVLKSLLLESRDIEKFQFIYRLKVETMVDVHKLATWMETRGVGMARLQKIRRWVDVTSAEVVSQPPRHYVRSHCVFGCMAMLTILGISNSLPHTMPIFKCARPRSGSRQMLSP